jgi:hypothetical protein
MLPPSLPVEKRKVFVATKERRWKTLTRLKGKKVEEKEKEVRMHDI